MRRLLHASGFWVLMALCFAAGLCLLGASAWLAPLREGDAALHAGDLKGALDRFAAAEARFERLPVARRILPDGYAASQANQLQALYRLGEHEALLEKAASSVERAPVHFWAGSALFARAAEEKDKQARISTLTRASEEFRKALQLAPDDWDVKHNYELAERLLAELRQPPRNPPKEKLQLLRPQPREGGRPTRRIG